MPGFTEAEARALLQKVLAFSKADACEANLTATVAGNIRFARNAVSTAGRQENVSLVIQSSFGSRAGTVTVNEFDDAALEAAVRRSEEIARLAPEDPEFVDPLGPQTYAANPAAFAEATAANTAAARADVAAVCIARAKQADCVAAGYLEDGTAWTAMANSKGLFAYHRGTRGSLTLTVRTNDGRGSGYAMRSFTDVGRTDAAGVARIAQEKAVASRETRAIEPGKYTVVLEPLASVDLFAYMINAMDRRAADEGRSFLSKPGGGNRLGERLMDPRVRFSSDPADPDVPSAPWAADGRPVAPVTWIEDGTVGAAFASRFWARKQGVPALPRPTNLRMAGGTESLEDLIRGTQRGILVTRTWYIRLVDPQTVLLTGLTRDGTFYIEDGQLRYAVKNMRFNESPVIMLNNLDALGVPQRVEGGEGLPPAMIPPLRVRDFTFTSLSDAV